MVNRDDCHPLREEITAHMLELFKGMGCNQAESCKYSEGVSDTLLKLYAGQDVHFPAESRVMIKIRNEEIIRRFTGDNVAELAEEWGLSKESVWRIAKHGKTWVKSDT